MALWSKTHSEADLGNIEKCDNVEKIIVVESFLDVTYVIREISTWENKRPSKPMAEKHGIERNSNMAKKLSSNLEKNRNLDSLQETFRADRQRSERAQSRDITLQSLIYGPVKKTSLQHFPSILVAKNNRS